MYMIHSIIRASKGGQPSGSHNVYVIYANYRADIKTNRLKYLEVINDRLRKRYREVHFLRHAFLTPKNNSAPLCNDGEVIPYFVTMSCIVQPPKCLII